MPSVGGDEGDPFDDDDPGTGIDGEAFVEQTVDADAYTDDGDEGTQPVQLYPVPADDGKDLDDVDDDDDDDDDDDSEIERELDSDLEDDDDDVSDLS